MRQRKVPRIYQLTETLPKRLDHSFDPCYTKRQRDKVIRQNLVELDRAKIEERIATTRESIASSVHELSTP
jgi:hypothetical protein